LLTISDSLFSIGRMPRPLEPYVYSDLTWPEINDAVRDGRVILLPVGATEQHGPHLPLEIDVITPTEICMEAGRRAPEEVLVMPTVAYGYTHHVMDFPGTINIAWDHFIHYVLDITKSLAHHGFRRIVIVNGHGSNDHLLELVGRQTNLQTEATCATLTWPSLIKDLFGELRDSVMPGGSAHACELEVSMQLHLRPDSVRMEHVKDELAAYPGLPNEFQWVDLMGAGPVTINEWTSTHTQSGIIGQAALGTAEKGERIFDAAADKLVRLVRYMRERPEQVRVPHQDPPPDGPLPF
jgi:creatinine amidohydrolase